MQCSSPEWQVAIFLNEGTEAKSEMEIFSIYKNKEDVTNKSVS